MGIRRWIVNIVARLLWVAEPNPVRVVIKNIDREVDPTPTYRPGSWRDPDLDPVAVQANWTDLPPPGTTKRPVEYRSQHMIDVDAKDELSALADAYFKGFIDEGQREELEDRARYVPGDYRIDPQDERYTQWQCPRCCMKLRIAYGVQDPAKFIQPVTKRHLERECKGR